jgi:hypothetical protein
MRAALPTRFSPALALGLALALAACSKSDAHLPFASERGTRAPGGGAGQGRDAGDARDASRTACDARCGEDAGAPDAARDATPSLDASGADARDAADGGVPRVPVTADAADDVPPGYPTGPYGGRAVGDVLRNLRWEGYVNDGATALSSTEPYVPYSLDDLHRSGKPWLLLHVADFDCAGCRSAASDMATLGPGVVTAGGAVVEVLASEGFTFVADRTHLDAWLATYDLRVTSVIDAPGHGLETLHVVGVRETSLIVDLATMKIVWMMNGDLGGVDPSSINAAAAEMHRRLGK